MCQRVRGNTRFSTRLTMLFQNRYSLSFCINNFQWMKSKISWCQNSIFPRIRNWKSSLCTMTKKSKHNQCVEITKICLWTGRRRYVLVFSCQRRIIKFGSEIKQCTYSIILVEREQWSYTYSSMSCWRYDIGRLSVFQRQYYQELDKNP